MLTSDRGFGIIGQYQKDRRKPYRVEFVDVLDGVSFWVKNKHLEVVAFNDQGSCVLKSEYKREGLFKGGSYVFFDELENVIAYINKGSPLKGHSVFLNDVKVGSILPQKKQEIKGIPLDIYSTGSSVEISSTTKKSPSLSDLCVGYFGWLIFKRWDEMD